MRARSRPAGREDPEAGMSLIELLVALSIMGFVMAIATAGLLPMYRLVNDADAQNRVQSTLSVAMLRLDRQIRYSDTVSVASDGLSARYRTVEPGTTRYCHRLRWSGPVTSGVLQQLRWPAASTPGTTWTTLATGLRSDRTGFTRPFDLVPPADDVPYQRLQVKLITTGDAGGSERHTDVTFTAVNTDTAVTNPC